jgi:O-acetyl-ADP-ribose deacetylase (regulator of RNase III)
MAEIHYVIGDATQPQGKGKKIIVHVCNNVGAWGAGFVLALSKRWKEPEVLYRQTKKRMLGDVQYVVVEPDIMVANMIAQHDVQPSPDGIQPIRYGAVRAALANVNDEAYRLGATIHMPRIGCGLAGGRWTEIEKILQQVISVDVYVYDLK